MALSVVVLSPDTELGREVISQLVTKGYRVTGISKDAEPKTLRQQGAAFVQADLTKATELSKAMQVAKPDVVLNLTPQIANTLLHDGHNSKGYDETLLTTTTALLEALADLEVKLLVHASYAFLYGDAQDAKEDTQLNPPDGDPIFQAAVEAEKQIANSNIPYCILRIGFLYGPQSQDLQKYETSFKLHRSYYAGPEDNLVNLLHYEDAAKALALVVEQQPVGKTFNVVDGTPTSFANFIDTYAQKLGYSKPPHIPLFTAPVAQVIIKEPQMEILERSTTVNGDRFRQEFNWTPNYQSYQVGLDRTIDVWQKQDAIDKQ
jgi:nucleoside-diphosphate-sugar epimerase